MKQCIELRVRHLKLFIKFTTTLRQNRKLDEMKKKVEKNGITLPWKKKDPKKFAYYIADFDNATKFSI